MPVSACGTFGEYFNNLRKRDYMFGVLAVYERQKTDCLAEAFVKAYQKITPHYVALMRYVQDGGVLGAPI